MQRRNALTRSLTFPGGDNAKCVQWMQERFPNLKHTVSLADHYSELSKENEEKLAKFTEKLSKD